MVEKATPTEAESSPTPTVPGTDEEVKKVCSSKALKPSKPVKQAKLKRVKAKKATKNKGSKKGMKGKRPKATPKSRPKVPTQTSHGLPATPVAGPTPATAEGGTPPCPALAPKKTAAKAKAAPAAPSLQASVQAPGDVAVKAEVCEESEATSVVLNRGNTSDALSVSEIKGFLQQQTDMFREAAAAGAEQSTAAAAVKSAPKGRDKELHNRRERFYRSLASASASNNSFVYDVL